MSQLSFGIIGYGRFGKVLHNLLEKCITSPVKIFDTNDSSSNNTINIKEVLSANIVFIAVPIKKFKECIEEISQYNLQNTTIVDVCSVKVYPVNVMQEILPNNIGIICSHPLFGPDSYSQFRELKMMMYPIRDMNNHYLILKKLFEKKAVRIVEMTPEKHDEMAASSQGITHFIGRVLDDAGIHSTKINTLGFNDLLGVIEQTCNDSWDLFKDLQNYNPYTKKMIQSIESAIKNVKNNINMED